MLIKPVKDGPADDPRWITSILLRTLAALAPNAGNRISGDALAAALPNLTTARRTRGTTKLLALGFITYTRCLVAGRTTYAYTVTAEGAAAIAAAASGAMLMAGRHGSRPALPGSLRARLWALMRMRKVLGAEEAVQLLADAGDPAFISKRNKANECLRRWQQAGVLELSAQVRAKGQKRYVLITDPGPAVPPFVTPIEAQKRAAR